MELDTREHEMVDWLKLCFGIKSDTEIVRFLITDKYKQLHNGHIYRENG